MNLPAHPIPATRTYFGKYRGLVVENIDPMQIGRVIAQVPAVLGLIPSSWAMPCVPAAGIQSGIFIVPPIGSQVWIEFEGGNPDLPIWTGGFWPIVADVPVSAVSPPPIPPGQNIVLQTIGGNVITLSDSAFGPSSGIILRTPGGATLIVSDAGIVIDNGKGANIQILGQQVIFNNAATLVGDQWSPAPMPPPD